MSASRPYRWPAWPLLLVLIGGAGAARAEHPVVAESRKHLYTSRERALALLEEAARREPANAEVWAAYVHALDVARFDHLADLAVRHALKARPGDPGLLMARARLLGGGGAIEVMSELAAVPGYEQIAPRLAEWTSLGLSLPGPGSGALGQPGLEGHALWCERLIVVGRLERAAAVIDEGIAAAPKRRAAAAAPLRARKAVVLALRGELDAALAEQRAAGWPEERLEGSWHGVADVFLAKGRADLALAAFGDRAPAKPPFRRLLGIIKSRRGDDEGAIALLKGGGLTEDHLLLIRAYVAAGRDADARFVGDKIVKRESESLIAYGGPWLARYEGPESLAEEYRAAVRWLHEAFPDRRAGIEQDFGTGDEPMERYRGGWSLVRPLTEETRAVEAKLASMTARPGTGGPDEVNARRWLAECYAKAARFDDAAGALEPVVLGPVVQAAEYYAVEWSMLRRRGDADRAAAADFWAVAAARPLLAAPEARRGNHRNVDPRRPWPTDAEVVAGLTAMGPPVLADVMANLKPNTVSGDDRRPWAAVIGATGAERDAPVLIATTALILQHLGGRGRPEENENDRLSLAVIDGALRTLTGKAPPAAAADPAGRLEFWRAWWQAERDRIVRAR